MTDPIRPRTPAEHRALAEIDLARMRGISAGTAAYSSLAQSALAHIAAAYLPVLAAFLDPDRVTEPETRMPGGWVVRARQSPAGERKWGYVITEPGDGGTRHSRYAWATQEAALAAGVQDAQAAGVQEQEAGPCA